MDSKIEKNKRKILIVDDDILTLKILEKVLSDSFTEVITTPSGYKALELVKNNEFNLIILDLNMPEISGFEICKILKNSEHTSHIPIIFITASKDFEDEIKGLKLGASDFIHKPFVPFVVNHRVELILKLHENIKILDKLVKLDDLTGISNRREYNSRIDTEIKRCQRTNSPISLIMIDIDYFKLYNDTYGHGMGDKCLTKVAKTIDSINFRKSDLFARYGGEEFALILPDTDVNGAYKVALKIQKTIDDLKIPHESSEISPYVTLSIGIASIVPNRDDTTESLEEYADNELYKAKKMGRNQISIFKRSEN